MPCEKTYPGITPDKWLKIITAAHPYGIWIDHSDGQTETFGVSFRWNYNEPKWSLRVTILRSGIVSDTDALGFLDNIIQQA